MSDLETPSSRTPPHSRPAAAAAVRDSNRPTLLALYQQLLGDAARVVDLGIVRDVDGTTALAAAIRNALARWVGVWVCMHVSTDRCMNRRTTTKNGWME